MQEQGAQTLKGLLTVRKSALVGLFLIVFVDSLITPKNSTPGHGATFLLAWVLMTRVWLKNPSIALLLICALTSITCIASNHGFVSISIIPHSFYFYAAVGVMILYWDKVADFAKRTVNKTA
jgi:hypothetical protein